MLNSFVEVGFLLAARALRGVLVDLRGLHYGPAPVADRELGLLILWRYPWSHDVDYRERATMNASAAIRAHMSA